MPRKKRLIVLDVGTADFLTEFRRRIFEGVMRYVARKPGWEIVFNTEPLWTFDAADAFSKIGAVGLIASTRLRSPFQEKDHARWPATVTVAGDEGLTDFPSVSVDNARIGQVAAEHLMDMGLRHFAFAGYAVRPYSQARHKAFRAALRVAGHEESAPALSTAAVNLDLTVEERIEKAQAGISAGADQAEEIERWLTELPKPVGVMAANDMLARYLLTICRQSRIDVPGQVAVIGVDNSTTFCLTSHPQLSSVDNDCEGIGFEAARTLDRILSGRKPSRHLRLIPPRGVIARMSTDIMAVGDPVIAKAIAHIRGHLAESLTIADVARAAGASRSMLIRKFRESLGRGVLTEIRRQRFEKAKILLADGDLSVKQIAERSGFSVPSLYAIFARRLGAPPAAWRKESRI